MYTLYNLTGDKDLIALNASDTLDINFAASKFASWLVIKIDLFYTQGKIISEVGPNDKVELIKWLEEQRDASSSYRNPDKQNTVRCGYEYKN
jgi:hypothetical protein